MSEAMARRVESVIFCEGYHDRALWKSLLLHHSCFDARTWRGRRAALPPSDPFGQTVAGGAFGFRTPAGHFVRVRPVQGGGDLLWRAALRCLEGRVTEPLAHLIVSSDSDAASHEVADHALPAAERLRRHGVAASSDDDGNSCALPDGTAIHITRWRDPGTPAVGVPRKQTLEALLCGTVAAVHPRRAENVDAWLTSRVDPPDEHPKAYALSHLAGWYPSAGSYEGWVERLMADDAIRAALLDRVERIGVGDVIRSLLAAPPSAD